MSSPATPISLQDKRLVIIGDGAWGNALKQVLQKNHPDVHMWDRSSSLAPYEIVLLTIPTASLSQVLANHSIPPHAYIINTSKGIEQNTLLLPHEIVRTMRPDVSYFTLIGPSFATEVEAKTPTLVNLGYLHKMHADSVARLFRTDLFHVRLTPDIEVIELFAAFKNVYAIASGLADGMAMKANTRAKLIVMALEELYEMMRISRLTIEPTSLPGTVGDLVLTAYSEESRNFRFGRALATKTVHEALTSIASTIEGYNTAQSIPRIAKKYGVKLPLAQLVYDMIQTKHPEKIRGLFIQFLHTY